jgi:alanyl-tRNA synthetase
MDSDTDLFDAVVTEVVKEKKGWGVVLDRTYFYPEGGGQPADRGWLGDIPVTDVQKDGDRIVHYLQKNPVEAAGVIKVNNKVTGRIDMVWRRDFMQQHTGQHIISGALWKIGGYKTVSVHMGKDYTAIEIEAPDIPEEHLTAVETLANRTITSNLPLSIIHSPHTELHRFPLRKPTPRTGDIRLVKIGDFDCVACGGLHFNSTGDVGLVKTISLEKIRGNIRIGWKIGSRAYNDYRLKSDICSALKPILSTGENQMVSKIRELIDDSVSAKRKANHIETRLAESIARNLFDNSEPLPGTNYRFIAASFYQEDHSLFNKLLKLFLKKDNLLVCLLNIYPDKIQWNIACSEDINFPFNNIKIELLQTIDGKGGGRHPLWQGMGLLPHHSEEFLSKLKSLSTAALSD